MEDNTHNESTNLLYFLFNNRKFLILVTTVGAIFSIVASLLIDNKYSAKVILYPSATNSVSKALLSDTYGGKADIMEFGEEEQAEQLLQILNSSDIRDSIIAKYNLMEHYEIPSDAKHPHTLLFEEYEDNFNYKRNEYMAVEIEVMDKDKELAAKMANDVAYYLDKYKGRIHKKRANQGFQIVSEQYNSLKSEIALMEDSLTVLMEKGVMDVQSQTEVLNRTYAEALIQKNFKAAGEIEEKLKVISKYGARHIALSEMLENQRKQLSVIKAKYEEAKVDAEAEITTFFQTDRAYVPEKKTYPVRWLIVAVSTFSTFIFATLLVIILQQYKRFREASV